MKIINYTNQEMIHNFPLIIETFSFLERKKILMHLYTVQNAQKGKQDEEGKNNECIHIW